MDKLPKHSLDCQHYWYGRLWLRNDIDISKLYKLPHRHVCNLRCISSSRDDCAPISVRFRLPTLHSRSETHVKFDVLMSLKHCIDMYDNLGIHWASSIPAFLALACAPFPFLFYKYGVAIRLSCKYAAAAAAMLEQLRSGHPLSQSSGHVEVDDTEKGISAEWAGEEPSLEIS
jgi:hypothetical protein